MRTSKKCADLVNLSTITQIKSYPLVDLGSLITKFIVILVDLILKSIFSDISMDFVKGLRRLGGKDVILVVVDRITKYNHFIPLAHPFTVDMVANAFMEYIYKLHGNLGFIVNDRGPTFVSKFRQELFKLQGVSIHLSSSYHP